MTKNEAIRLLAREALLMFEHDGSSTLDGDTTLHIINQIFDEHEAQLKAKEEEIYKYQMAIDKQSKRAEALKQLSLYKDKEIERLKEFEEMVEWMELNSNRSLCDYCNNKDNA